MFLQSCVASHYMFLSPQQVIGMDLSPYMLAVAELRERQWEQKRQLQLSGASPLGGDAAAVGADSIPGSTKRQRIT